MDVDINVVSFFHQILSIRIRILSNLMLPRRMMPRASRITSSRLKLKRKTPTISDEGLLF